MFISNWDHLAVLKIGHYLKPSKHTGLIYRPIILSIWSFYWFHVWKSGIFYLAANWSWATKLKISSLKIWFLLLNANALCKAVVKMEKLEYPGLFHRLSQIFLFEQFQSPSCSVLKRYTCCVTQNKTKNIRNTFQDTKHFVKVWKYQHIWNYIEREWIYMTQTLVWRLVNMSLMSQDVFLHCNCKHSKISLPAS